MALETFGTDIERMINNSVLACHDLVKDTVTSDGQGIGDVNFHAGQKGMWAVYPSMLDGVPAVEIRIAVG